ncbi:uncharacterized protein G2W53_013926 [Senna tora]|uniref:Secreted protein n=1 Tax=Senna tora TaxID=362788 RepID=A0A834TZK4_9FABA|nr:uncharacterized protein G2W53_013926 [Senna tora]
MGGGIKWLPFPGLVALVSVGQSFRDSTIGNEYSDRGGSIGDKRSKGQRRWLGLVHHGIAIRIGIAHLSRDSMVELAHFCGIGEKRRFYPHHYALLSPLEVLEEKREAAVYSLPCSTTIVFFCR